MDPCRDNISRRSANRLRRERFGFVFQFAEGTRRLYERLGFTYVRPKGLKNCVMSIEVPAQP